MFLLSPRAGIGVVDEPQLLYNMMHSYLQQAGVDGVKVDCQAGVGLAGGQRTGWPGAAGALVWALDAYGAACLRGDWNGVASVLLCSSVHTAPACRSVNSRSTRSCKLLCQLDALLEGRCQPRC